MTFKKILLLLFLAVGPLISIPCSFFQGRGSLACLPAQFDPAGFSQNGLQDFSKKLRDVFVLSQEAIHSKKRKRSSVWRGKTIEAAQATADSFRLSAQNARTVKKQSKEVYEYIFQRYPPALFGG